MSLQITPGLSIQQPYTVIDITDIVPRLDAATLKTIEQRAWPTRIRHSDLWTNDWSWQ